MAASGDRPALRWPARCKACLETNLQLVASGKGCWAGRGAGANRVPSVAAILHEAFDAILAREGEGSSTSRGGTTAAERERDAELTEFALCFVGDLLESAATVSLLNPQERKGAPAPPKGYKALTVTPAQVHAAGAAINAAGPQGASPLPPPAKKVHTETAAAAAAAAGSSAGDAKPPPAGAHLRALTMQRHYLQHCTVEHLLRILATIPQIVEHYVVLNAAAHDAPEDKTARVEGMEGAVGAWLWPRVQALLDYVDTHIDHWATPAGKYVALPT
jgi:hypothetical protein